MKLIKSGIEITKSDIDDLTKGNYTLGTNFDEYCTVAFKFVKSVPVDAFLKSLEYWTAYKLIELIINAKDRNRLKDFHRRVSVNAFRLYQNNHTFVALIKYCLDKDWNCKESSDLAKWSCEDYDSHKLNVKIGISLINEIYGSEVEDGDDD
jgi:hypothetical protein